ncbi:hypothetical protein CJ030_MR7G002563 [Morella rubra]|uniref:Rab-GAP TBC domain-containing protein n=1 Tax=Morella rubra TaxID=262757 RepID=A0A6A1V5Q0_9ROSI|nr:hypothetical protein CJ030_MR7G002563 [Morella rubra]
MSLSLPFSLSAWGSELNYSVGKIKRVKSSNCSSNQLGRAALRLVLPGFYRLAPTIPMTFLNVDQLVFEELMRERFPKLVNHLDCLEVQVAWISRPWFLSIFVNMLPRESGLALVTTRDAGDAITLLQSLVGSTFDNSQLVLMVCMGYIAVIESRLQEMRKKHRPAVLAVVEERSRRGRVWKDSKGLASKLYSFKHDDKDRGK